MITSVPLVDVRRWPGVLGPNTHRIAGYLRGEGRALGVIALLVVLYVPATLLEPYILQYLVDRIMVVRRPELVGRFALVVFPLLMAGTAVECLLSYSLFTLARSLQCRIKSQQIDNLMGKGVSFFKQTASGRVLFAFFNDSGQIAAILSIGLANALINGLVVIARIVVLLWIDVWLTVVYLALAIPVQGAITYRVMQATMGLEIALKKADEDLTAGLESLLRGILVVKALGLEGPLTAVWKTRFVERLDLDLRNLMWRQFGALIVTNLHVLATFIVMFTAVWQMASGSLSLGAVLAFVTVGARINPSLQVLMGFFVGMQEVLVNIERFFRVQDIPDERRELSADTRHAVPLSADAHVVALQDVVVCYPTRNVHIPCDVTLEPGGRYLLHGPNGVGKTSLALATAAIVPHVPGGIRCAGVPLSAFDPVSVRRQILYVGAEPFWPEQPIGASFGNGHGQIDRGWLTEVLEVSAAADVLDALPGGLETVLTNDAHILSRGESQRLFLAVALCRRPRVLLLDEALSAVSTRLMDRILANLQHWPHVPIIVHVSHRQELYRTCTHIELSFA